ncbi:hypothetical protein STRDD11_02538 [Streptococcus sp. DD11]|nr:hypothetical protein STRDD11_02538 [Streptococcus sp. DD11]
MTGYRPFKEHAPQTIRMDTAFSLLLQSLAHDQAASEAGGFCCSMKLL